MGTRFRAHKRHLPLEPEAFVIRHENQLRDFTPLTPANILSWVHFGDLHLTTEDAQNYQDFVAVIANANIHLAGPGGVNFALLPGDNAENGTEAQYASLVRALDKLSLPVHALPGAMTSNQATSKPSGASWNPIYRRASWRADAATFS